MDIVFILLPVVPRAKGIERLLILAGLKVEQGIPL